MKKFRFLVRIIVMNKIYIIMNIMIVSIMIFVL